MDKLIVQNICFMTTAMLLVIACNVLSPPQNQANVSVPTKTEATVPAVAPTRPLPSPTPAPEIESAAQATTLPQIIEADALPSALSVHHQAMLPVFVDDVETVAAGGASQYFIEAQLEPIDNDSTNGLQLTGQERIIYTNTESDTLNELYFRLYPNLPGYGGYMGVETIMLNNQAVSPTLEAGQAALRVPLPSPLSPGDNITISLNYSATVPSHSTQGYNIFSYTDNTAALAGFYPALAAYDQRGWDTTIPPVYGDATYLDTSLYQVQVTVPEEMVVAATGSTISTTHYANGTKMLTMVSGPVRDFYIAMRPDFAVISDSVDGITVNSYYLPEAERGGTLALQYAVDALREYNQQFGPYPYAEFDVVATPTTAGGVEYPGIVVVAQGLYGQQGGFFEHVIAHEVAHQWWYGLVGNDQVHEPWLDEALTNYSAIVYWENVQSPQVAKTIVDQFYVGPYRQAQRSGQDRAVIGPVSDFSQAEYAAIVYSKGALFFEALHQEVGDAKFAEIMQNYLATHKYGIARAEDLYDSIEQVSDLDIEPLRQTWLQQP